MQKLGTWSLAIFVAAVFALLSVSSFQGWEQGPNGNRMINMVIDLQKFMIDHIGNVATGVVFAAAGILVLWLAWRETSRP